MVDARRQAKEEALKAILKEPATFLHVPISRKLKKRVKLAVANSDGDETIASITIRALEEYLNKTTK